MQAVKDSKRSALKSSEFSIIIDKYSSGVELEVPQDSIWKVIPDVAPAKVQCMYMYIMHTCHDVDRLHDAFLRSTWLLFLTINLEEPFHKLKWISDVRERGSQWIIL